MVMTRPPASKSQKIRTGNYYLSWSGLTCIINKVWNSVYLPWTITILLFQRNAWLLLHVVAHCVLLFALNDRGYVLWHVAKTPTRTQKVLEFRRNLSSMWWGNLQRLVESYLQASLERISAAARTWARLTIAWRSRRHGGHGRPSGPLYVRDRGATFRAMYYVGILIQLPCRGVTFYYVIFAKRCNRR